MLNFDDDQLIGIQLHAIAIQYTCSNYRNLEIFEIFEDNWSPMCFNLRFLEKMFIQIFIWFGKVYLDMAILLATRWKLDLTRWSKIRTSIFTVVTSLDCVICTVKTINVPNNTVLNGSSQTVKLLDLEHRYELKMNDGQGRSLTARHP